MINAKLGNICGPAVITTSAPKTRVRRIGFHSKNWFEIEYGDESIKNTLLKISSNIKYANN